MKNPQDNWGLHGGKQIWRKIMLKGKSRIRDKT